MTASKSALQEQAAKLGLDPEGTVAELTERIAAATRPVEGLVWVGEATGRFIPGVPARHLDAGDLARLVFKRTAGKVEGRIGGLRPAEPGFAEQLAEVVASLTRTKLYQPGDVDAARKADDAAPDPAPPSDEQGADAPPEQEA